jgi:hypothetical protein
MVTRVLVGVSPVAAGRSVVAGGNRTTPARTLRRISVIGGGVSRSVVADEATVQCRPQRVDGGAVTTPTRMSSVRDVVLRGRHTAGTPRRIADPSSLGSAAHVAFRGK